VTRPRGVAGALRLQIHLRPRARHNQITGRQGEAWRVQVHAAPQDGAANAALIDLLAETLAVPRRSIRIVHGTTARDKVVEVEGADPLDCQRRLDAALAARVDKRGAGD
jgi:uncharacterized protein (TIGR00251 family)